MGAMPKTELGRITEMSSTLFEMRKLLMAIDTKMGRILQVVEAAQKPSEPPQVR
jgi:hypothetical protein